MTLDELNRLPPAQLRESLTQCCGAAAWIEKMMYSFPVDDETALLNTASLHWHSCSEQDWKEAFTHHPRIGDLASLQKKFASTAQWAAGEQAGAVNASMEVLQSLAEGNRLYEEKFGYIFIVCATGKPAAEMLQLLNERLQNNAQEEIKTAMEEQLKITIIRLKKLLMP